MLSIPTRALGCALLLASLLILPTAVDAASVGNPLCPGEEVLFNPGNGEDIVVPDGFKVSVFAAGLNFPTGIAFRGDSRRFEVYVLESGAFGPSRCDNGVAWQGAGLPGNPFTPDIRVFDRSAKLLRTLGKPTDAGSPNANAFQPSGPAVDIAFELGLAGGAAVRNRQRGQWRTHSKRRSDDRKSHPADHRAPGRPDRTACASRRMDLLGRRVYDQ